MANPPVNPAGVNPVGGASSSWGPGEIVLNPDDDKPTQLMDGLSQGGVVVTDGTTKGFIHNSKLNQFLSDNPTYEKGTVFSGPNGKLAGVVKASQAGDFQKNNPGYTPGVQQTPSYNPAQTSPFASLANFRRAHPELEPPQINSVSDFVKAASPLGAFGLLGAIHRNLGMTKIPLEALDQVAQEIKAEGDDPRAHPWVRDYLAPAAEAAADKLRGFYTPQGWATAGALSALPAVSTGTGFVPAAMRTLNRAIGGYFAGSQANEAANQASQGIEAARRGDTAEAVRQLTGAGLGTGMAVDAGRQTVNDVMVNPQRALTDLRTTAQAPISATRYALDPLSNMTPAEIMSRGTKPRNQLRDVMPKIEQALPHARAAANQLGIDVNTMGHDEALAATRQAKQNIWNTLEQNHLAPAATFMRDTTSVADKIRAVADGMSDIAKRRNPNLVDSINAAADDYHGQQMSVSDMEQRIQELNNELYAEQSRLKVRQDTLKRDPTYGYKFAELEGLRGSLNEALDQITGPGASNLKRTYGSLKTLEDILDSSRNVANRPSPVGIFQGLGHMAGVGNLTGGAWQTFTGHPEIGLPQMAKGGAQAWLGEQAQRLNNRNFLVGEAFRRTTPAGAPPGPSAAAQAAAATVPPTGGAPATTPAAPTVPPWTGAGQAPIQFTGGTAQATPSVLPSAAPAEPPIPNVPLFRQAQPKPQTPTPSEKVAPAAPQAPPKPSYTPEQTAAVEQAVTHANNGVTDIETHAPLREQAYRPELEPERLHGISAEKNREGQRGLSTKEVNAPNGEYTPEVQERHQQQVDQILGKDTGRAEDHPVVIIQGGGAASGKSEAIGKALQAKYPGIAVSDSDVIKFGDAKKGIQGMPEAEALKQSDPLGAAARLHEESSDISKMVAKEALRRHQSIILDGVGGNVEKLKEQIAEFKREGYRVEVHYADRDVNEALKSMTTRFNRTQRWVPPDVMAEGHRKAAATFPQIAALPEVDESSLSMAKRAGSTDLSAGKYDIVHRNGKIENEARWSDYLKKGERTNGRNGLQGRGLDREGHGRTEGSGTAGVGEAPQTAGTGAPEATGPAKEVTPLHIADNAPPKDKPVTLVYGGAFSPAHEGHVSAIQEAHDQLTANGYNVDRILVSPTADKLLAKKQGASLPLEDRANIASAQFPREINGTPVEVSTGPAQEVEAKQGKPRRTDLADFAQRERPDHAVINVAGDDAGVPGSPDVKGPKLYQGAPGSNHEGYNYLETPRIGDISSSKIRAAVASGEKIPGMNPESERLYREALARQEARGTATEPTEAAAQQNEMFGAPPERGIPPPGEVGRVPVSALSADPHRFQYKANTDTQGVSTLLKETKKWNPDLAGVVSVWTDPADGKTYVVNGHHRFELAKRLGVPDMVVRHIAADTAEEARSIGAMQNIAEGRGTAIDAAKFFRDTGRGPEDLQRSGISLSESKVHDGLALSRLDPSIFQRVVNGDLKQGRAIAIGEAGLDPAQQRSIVDSIEKRERSGKNVTDGTVSELIRLEKGAARTTETQSDLFGSQQIERSLGFEKAEISDYVKQQIAREKRTFGFVSKGGRAQELAKGGNVIDVERSGAISSGAAQAAEVYDKLSTRGGPISDILDEASRRLADGENVATVKAEAYNRIRQAISETLGQKLEQSHGRLEGTP